MRLLVDADLARIKVGEDTRYGNSKLACTWMSCSGMFAEDDADSSGAVVAMTMVGYLGCNSQSSENEMFWMGRQVRHRQPTYIRIFQCFMQGHV